MPTVVNIIGKDRVKVKMGVTIGITSSIVLFVVVVMVILLLTKNYYYYCPCSAAAKGNTLGEGANVSNGGSCVQVITMVDAGVAHPTYPPFPKNKTK